MDHDLNNRQFRAFRIEVVLIQRYRKHKALLLYILNVNNVHMNTKYRSMFMFR